MPADPMPSSPGSRSVTALLEEEVERLRYLKRRTDPVRGLEMLRRIDRAIQAAECPTCAESQPDGVPCASAARSCDRCTEALHYVRSLRTEIEASAKPGAGDDEI